MQDSISEIESDIESIGADSALLEELNFEARTETIDYIEFYVTGRIESMLQSADHPHNLLILKEKALSLQHSLEKVNDQLFNRLRSRISSGELRGSTLREVLTRLAPSQAAGYLEDATGYDNLDILVNGLSPAQELPVETIMRAPEMLYYQKTPARIIFDLAARLGSSENTVLYDLGAGLGQLCILINLLNGIKTIGIDIEPAFIEYARKNASALHLRDVKFLTGDVRSFSFEDGTHFYLYTPFTGSVLQDVVNMLKQQATHRTIRIFSFGPGTLELAKTDWLTCLHPGPNQINCLTEFRSLSFSH